MVSTSAVADFVILPHRSLTTLLITEVVGHRYDSKQQRAPRGPVYAGDDVFARQPSMVVGLLSTERKALSKSGLCVQSDQMACIEASPIEKSELTLMARLER